MGLESVELIMAFEEEFGFEFDDFEAENFFTPNDIVDYISPRVRKNKGAPCLSQKGFYKIRKAIVKTFNSQRSDIHPDTNLNDILGKDTKKNWNLLQKAIDLNYFPSLKCSKFIVLTIYLLPFLACITLFLNSVPLEILPILYILLIILISYFTSSMGSIIPRKYSTVGSLIPFVECSKSTIWSKEDILKRVIEITSEQLGIPIKEIKGNTQFVSELGVDQ